MNKAPSTVRTRIILGVFAALVLGWSGSAAAEKKRVGVPKFDGAQEAVVRKAVMQVLKAEGYELVKSREIDAAARSTGAPLDSNDGFKAVAKELSISSFVTGEVGKKKAKLTVRNGADGAVSGEGSFAAANPNKVASEVRESFARRLGSAVQRGKVPGGAKKPQVAAAAPEPDEADDAAGGAASSGDDADKPAPKPSARKADALAAKNDDDGGKASPSADEGAAVAVARKEAPPVEDETGPRIHALSASLGFRGFSRSLSYNQDLYKALREYKLALGPAVAVSVTAYPIAFVSSGIAANIGVQLDLEQAFGVSSNVPAGGSIAQAETFPTVIHDFSGAVRVRLPFGASNELSLLAGGGEHAFAFRSSGSNDRSVLDIPDTIYRYARFGAEGRFELASGFTAKVGAGYRLVLNKAGQISQAADPANGVVGFFPYLNVAGVDFNAAIGYAVTPSIQVSFGVDVRRYFYNMHSAPEDLGAGNKVAGGAVDQYVAYTLAAGYVFDVAGGGGGADEPEAEEAPAAEAAPAPKAKKAKAKTEESDEDEDN